MMRRLYKYLLLAVVVAFMASCSSVRRTQKMPMVGELSGTEFVEKVISSSTAWNSVAGKASLELQLGEKEKTRVNASLKIRRGEVIQLSVTPVLGIEVARLELTPQGLLLVDRMNKRFVKASFTEVSQLLHVDVNFHILQSLFMNELFLPGRTSLTADDVSSFRLSAADARVRLQPKKMKKVSYQFFASPLNGALEQTILGLKGTEFALDWEYGDFTELEGRLFPKRTTINLRGASETYALRLKMSRLSADGKWSGQTKLSSRYKEIPLREILKVLFKL